MNTLQKSDSVISSHLYVNSSPAITKTVLGTNEEKNTNLDQNSSKTVIPLAPPTPSNNSAHKNSFKGAKLARRARSFKDDLFEKIYLMRTPNSTLGRSNSPNSPRNKNASTKPPPTAEEVAKSSQSLDTHVKDICNALKHFRDVILKKKLEVLPGNGTVILETIASMFAVIQSYTSNENSTTLLSATQQVYLSLGKLIKLCDEVMLIEEINGEDSPLSNENVRQVIDVLEDSVKNLVSIAQIKLKEKEENAFRYNPSVGESQNLLMRPQMEVAGQRTSLPDITLTPKERDSLEKSQSVQIRASHSTESVLRSSSPPTKPPLPNRNSNPPPLPPKRRNQPHMFTQSTNSDSEYNADFPLINYGVEQVSLRSRSPDENSSQCSFDSALNNSREEDELKSLILESRYENLPEDDLEKSFIYNNCWNKNGTLKKTDAANSLNATSISSLATGVQCLAATTINATISNRNDNERTIQNIENTERIEKTVLTQISPINNRHSNESGFTSLKSYRTSTQSVSKRSSEYSFHSSTKSSSSESNTSLSTKSSNFTELQEQPKLLTPLPTASLLLLHNDEEKYNMQSIENSSPEIVISENQVRTYVSSSKTVNMDVPMSEEISIIDNVPPALPPKTLKSKEKQINRYENFDEIDDSLSDVPELRKHQLHAQSMHWETKHQSLMEPRRSDGISGSRTTIAGETSFHEAPPLPMKKKHILAYMEICSASTRPVDKHRHTMYTCNLTRNITHSQTMNVVTVPMETTPERDIPPALPPKTGKFRKSICTPPTIITTPPPSPKSLNNIECLNVDNQRYNRVLNNNNQGTEFMTTLREETSDNNDEESATFHRHNIVNDDQIVDEIFNNDKTEIKMNDNDTKDTEKKEKILNLLEELDILPYLELKKDNEDCPEVKGGYIDALIVHATRNQKIIDNGFSEAFITTFRTFIEPIDVIEKLIHRYTIFFCHLNDQKQKSAKETFSLLVRVVSDLTYSDLTNQLLALIVEFIFQLVCSGQLYLAKVLRNKFVEKVTLYKEQKLPLFQTDMFSTTTNQPSLLDLKSIDIAEQMTLLDADLFQKIEIPEVLLFAKEQCEEKSPNLNKFTEHFNKMSYWARSKILMLPDAKDREKHVIKFMKIMKHLRKMNNYNSYLALLSALDSAAIRRLEWPKTITEGLKEYCTLIDSSSSFRVYRQALSETSPPCIPYIGLVLQDLTFVHEGNPDFLREGVINFSKRWQQYNIIVNMKRFKKCSYPFKRNERIIRFFENFENYLGEEEMWQISESIKPRGKRTT